MKLLTEDYCFTESELEDIRDTLRSVVLSLDKRSTEATEIWSIINTLTEKLGDD